MPDEITDAIEASAAGPKKASGDSGSVEMHPLSEQIEADQYLSGKTAVSRAHRGLRQSRCSPPGAREMG